ncbi:serine/threonine protein kinase [Shewanella sp. KCT]|uniref:serine/threonine protein kinase n=1 Tax=Shewanella sp. KCT TaxID=2569535 RepID=UPI00118446FA|nr:serine/threonine-protein kinase [Shewanella sp. KCT]TVP16339.1 serine/threonine protein kinase [Shewanella sp. KCT]
MSSLYEHYSHLLELTPTEQQAYLQKLKSDNNELYQRLLVMLDVPDLKVTKLFKAGLEYASEGMVDFLAEGDIVGKYQIVRRIGQGGMGYVYLGERQDGTYSQVVAIKAVSLSLMSSEEDSLFNYEAQTLASLSHPNVVTILDAGQDSRGIAYVVMPYIKGKSITEYCNRLTASADKVSIFIQVLDGIVHSHANQVLHRDIKPDNLLVDDEGRVHVIDFGISKLMGGEGSPSQSYLNALSIDYASPEQKAGERITIASDIYSLGKVLEKLLPDDDIVGKIAAKASARHVDDRYQTAAELKNELLNYLAHRPILAHPSRVYNTGLWFKRHKLAVLLTMGISIAATVTGYQYYQTKLESLQQAELADGNLKLAEAMLAQVDVKVVSEIERQRALVESASQIELELLPKAQAVRFTLSLMEANKVIGDYAKARQETNKLLELTAGLPEFLTEHIIATKFQLELDVLDNRSQDLEQRLTALIDAIRLVPNTHDDRLFALVDWEVGSVALSNNKYHQLFETLVPHLVPKNVNQEILLQHIKIIAESNVLDKNSLKQLETLLDKSESDIASVSAKRWASLLHDWYLMSNLQGKQSVENLNNRIVSNTGLLSSLYDNKHPSVYVLAILAKQSASINRFKLGDVIDEIYKNVDVDSLPAVYRTNYFIIELTNAINEKRFSDAYQVMRTVYPELSNYGENALNYYLQFSVFANAFDKQGLYLNQLQLLMEHYKSKGNLGHAGYFAYSLCSSSSKQFESNVIDIKTGLAACNDAIGFYQKHYGEKSNFYILSLVAKLQLYIKLGDKDEVRQLVATLEKRLSDITYPTTQLIYLKTMALASLTLQDLDTADEIINKLAVLNNVSAYDLLLLQLERIQAGGDSIDINAEIKKARPLNCEALTKDQLYRLKRYVSGKEFDALDLCPRSVGWSDIVKSPGEAQQIYGSAKVFIPYL